MIKFLHSLLIFLKLYRMGYNLSGLASTCRNGTSGFYRLNYSRNGVEEFAILDIDFMIEKKNHNKYYSHIHGGSQNTRIFRVEGDQITISSKMKKED